MLKLLTAYGSAAATFVVLDMIWLSTMGALLYKPLLGPILAEQVRIAPAAIFYTMYIAGLVFFCVLPALDAERWTVALLNGAVLGLLAYGAYDLTNHATLAVWDVRVTLADMAWGCFVSAASSVAGYSAAAWLVGRA